MSADRALSRGHSPLTGSRWGRGATSLSRLAKPALRQEMLTNRVSDQTSGTSEIVLTAVWVDTALARRPSVVKSGAPSASARAT